MIVLYDALLPYAAYFALVLRIWVGANLVIHGRPKLGKGAEGAAGFAKTLGTPAVAAKAVTYLELVGGVFLIIGLIVPIVALLLMIQFAAISIAKKTKMRADYISPGKPSYEMDILYLILAIAIFVLGSGVLSIDLLIGV